MVTKISSTADEYLNATKRRKVAEAERNRRGDDCAPEDERSIIFYQACIAQSVAADAYQATADDVRVLRRFIVEALSHARAEFEACEGAEAPIAPLPADAPITDETLETLAEMFAERDARIAALEARRARARSRVAGALGAFRVLEGVARSQRKGTGLPGLPPILPDQNIFGVAGTLAYSAPTTAHDAATMLEAIATAAKPKPLNGAPVDVISLREAEKSRDCRLKREAEARSVMQRGRAEAAPAPAQGFVSR